KALTWWNSQIHTRGREAVVDMSWEDFKDLTREEFCPSNEMQKLETEMWNHGMVGAGHAAYTDRFHELARLGPHLVTPESKSIERYVYGFALQIRGMVAATEPKTIQKAMQLAGTLIDEALRNGSIKKNPEKRGSRGEIARIGIVVPRNVNLINARNQVIRACYKCGSTDHIKSACPRSWEPKEPGKRKGIHVRSRGGSPGPEHRDPPDDLQRLDGKKPTPGSKQEKWRPIKLLMIEGKILKDKGNPLGTITKDRRVGIGSPYTEYLTMDCSLTCPKSQERSLPQKDYGHDTNDCLQLRNQIEEAVKLGQLSRLAKGIKK
nr:reverse transcriptase domain-containing protein [Tanacetum cinerariifolium]